MMFHVERARLRPGYALALVWTCVAVLVVGVWLAAAHMFDRDDAVRWRAIQRAPSCITTVYYGIDLAPPMLVRYWGYWYAATYCTGGAVLHRDGDSMWCQR